MQEERYIVTVDFGTSKTALSVISTTGNAMNPLFYKSVESEGVIRGNIFNPQKAAMPLKGLIEEAQKECGIQITKVVVGLPRWDVKAERISHKLKRSDASSYISAEDIQNLKNMAVSEIENTLDDKSTIYGILTQSFSTEDMFQVEEDDVIGATGDELEGNFLVFIGQRKYKDNIDRVINELGIALSNYAFSPMCESKFVLTDEEKDHGVALIEIGAAITSVSVYHKGIMRAYRAFPFGGKSITSDIHTECSCPLQIAERIKIKLGYCMPNNLLSMENKIIQIELREGESNQVSIKYLSEIIEARMKEIINACMFIIGESGYADKLRCGLVLSGGAVQIHCCTPFITSLTGLPCRIAYPQLLKSPADNAMEGIALSAAGNRYINCAQPQDDKDSWNANGTIFNDEEIKPEITETKSNPAPKPSPSPTPTPSNSAKPSKKKKRNIILDRVGSLFEGFYSTIGGDDNE